MADKETGAAEATAPAQIEIKFERSYVNTDLENLPPPPPYFQPLPEIQQTSTLVISPTSLTPLVGSAPTRLRCPNCSAEIISKTNYKSGCLTWSISAAVCAAGLFVPCAWFGCQLVPFCVDSLKDVVHTCPNCKGFLFLFYYMCVARSAQVRR